MPRSDDTSDRRRGASSEGGRTGSSENHGRPDTGDNAEPLPPISGALDGLPHWGRAALVVTALWWMGLSNAALVALACTVALRTAGTTPTEIGVKARDALLARSPRTYHVLNYASCTATRWFADHDEYLFPTLVIYFLLWVHAISRVPAPGIPAQTRHQWHIECRYLPFVWHSPDRPEQVAPPGAILPSKQPMLCVLVDELDGTYVADDLKTLDDLDARALTPLSLDQAAKMVDRLGAQWLLSLVDAGRSRPRVTAAGNAIEAVVRKHPTEGRPPATIVPRRIASCSPVAQAAWNAAYEALINSGIAKSARWRLAP